jgi:hypothetical protein
VNIQKINLDQSVLNTMTENRTSKEPTYFVHSVGSNDTSKEVSVADPFDDYQIPELPEDIPEVLVQEQ